MDSVWGELTLIAIGILLNGFFSGSEIALVSARISRLAQLRETGIRGAATAMRLKEMPDVFLATIQIAITLVGTISAAVGGAAASQALTPLLAELGHGGAAQPVALGLVVVTIAYASLVVGELAPKAFALRHPERIACFVARPIQALSRFSSGLVSILTVSTNAVLAVLGVGRHAETVFVTEEEVRYLVREGAAKGIFEKTEEQLVQNAFEFADTTVREIMVPRVNVHGIPVTAPFDEALRLAAEINHSRIPLYRDSIEDPVGVLLMKDLLRAAARAESPPLTALARPPLFVPETSKISMVLAQFQRHRQNLAMVVDEYGAVVGLVTIEDILEEIVGDIREEGETEPRTIVRLADGALVVDGLAPVEALRDAGLPVEESREYSTAAGFVIAALDAIPMAGVAVTRSGYRWTVLETDGPRLRKLKVERVEHPSSGLDINNKA